MDFAACPNRNSSASFILRSRVRRPSRSMSFSLLENPTEDKSPFASFFPGGGKTGGNNYTSAPRHRWYEPLCPAPGREVSVQRPSRLPSPPYNCLLAILFGGAHAPNVPVRVQPVALWVDEI